jgi:hypothetical protein
MRRFAERRDYVYSTIAVTGTFPSVYHLVDRKYVSRFSHDHVLSNKIHPGHNPQSRDVLHFDQTRLFHAQLR